MTELRTYLHDEPDGEGSKSARNLLVQLQNALSEWGLRARKFRRLWQHSARPNRDLSCDSEGDHESGEVHAMAAPGGDQGPLQASEDLGRFVQTTLSQLKIIDRRINSNQ
jgi:hypothetical protein